MELILYKTYDSENTINKKLEEPLFFEVSLPKVENVNTLILRLSSNEDLTSYNYSVIKHFGRSYFIEQVVRKNSSFYELTLVIDVLETYKDDILSSKQLVNEQKITVDINIVESDVDVDEMLASLDDTSYILTTLGVDY